MKGDFHPLGEVWFPYAVAGFVGVGVLAIFVVIIVNNDQYPASGKRRSRISTLIGNRRSGLCARPQNAVIGAEQMGRLSSHLFSFSRHTFYQSIVTF